MISFSVKPPEPCRPSRAGKNYLGGLYPKHRKGLSRLVYPPVFWLNSGGLYPLHSKVFTRPQPLDVLQTSAAFGRHDCLPL